MPVFTSAASEGMCEPVLQSVGVAVRHPKLPARVFFRVIAQGLAMWLFDRSSLVCCPFKGWQMWQRFQRSDWVVCMPKAARNTASVYTVSAILYCTLSRIVECAYEEFAKTISNCRTTSGLSLAEVIWLQEPWMHEHAYKCSQSGNL